MIIKKIFLFFILLAVVSKLNAQNEPVLDSLLDQVLVQKDIYSKTKTNISNGLRTYLIDNKKFKNIIKHNIQNYVKHRDSTQIAYVYLILNYSVSNFDPVYGQEFLLEGLRYISPKNKKGFVDFYGNIGADYAMMGMDVLALKNSLKALDYIKQYKLDKQDYKVQYIRRLLTTNIAQLYLEQKNLPLAIKYNNESILLNRKQPNEYGLKFLRIIEINLAAEIAHIQGNNALAKNYLLQSLSICRKLGEPEREIEVLIKLGNYDTEYDKKIDYHEEAYKIAKSIKYPNTYSISSYLKLTDTYLTLVKNWAEFSRFGTKYNKNYYLLQAEQLLKATNNDIKIINSKKDLAETYLLYSQLKELQQNYAEAFSYSKKYHQLYDSIYSQENKNKLAALQNISEIESRDRQIELNQYNVKAKERQFLYLTIVLVLVCIIVIALFYQNRLRKKKNNELDKANRLKVQFFNILNHDLRSPLGELIQFLLLQQEAPDLLDQETKERFEALSIQSARRLLSSMEDLLLWGKAQIENFKPNYENIYIEELFEDMNDIFENKNKVDIVWLTDSELSLFTDINYLKTIMRNLTANAFKVLENTENAQITWRAQQIDGKIILSITDNGPGGTDEQFKALYDEKEAVGIKNGLGLHLVRDMAKAIEFEIIVKTIQGAGTTIILKSNKFN